jgi:hypothetical protein
VHSSVKIFFPINAYFIHRFLPPLTIGHGNVVDTKNVSGYKAPISFGLGLETRLNSLVSMRFMGTYSQLSHSKGRAVVAENGIFTTMQQSYDMVQLGANSAALLHFNNFYGGAGLSYTSSKASGFQTAEQVGSSTLPQSREIGIQEYSKLKADVLKPKQTDFAGNLFVGYKMVASANVLVSLEMGVAQGFYGNVQLNFPLSRKTNTSLAEWKKGYRLFQKVRKEAVALDAYLHPAKFQSSDTYNSTSNNSCPR